MHNLLIGIDHESFIDSYWSLIHLLSGIMIGGAILYRWRRKNRPIDKDTYASAGFPLLLLWEYFELSLRYIDRFDRSLEEYLTIIIPRIFFRTEGILNIIGDLALGSLGLALVYWYTRQRPGIRKW